MLIKRHPKYKNKSTQCQHGYFLVPCIPRGRFRLVDCIPQSIHPVQWDYVKSPQRHVCVFIATRFFKVKNRTLRPKCPLNAIASLYESIKSFQFVSFLPSSVAAIDEESAASHEAASIRQAEESRAAEFLGNSQTTKHVLSFPSSAGSGVLLKDLVDHGGDDVAWAEGVDADTVAAPFHREGAGELDNGCFGAVVNWGSHAFVGDEAGHGCDEEDGAFLLVVEHLTRGRGGRVEDTVVVDGHYVV